MKGSFDLKLGRDDILSLPLNTKLMPRGWNWKKGLLRQAKDRIRRVDPF